MIDTNSNAFLELTKKNHIISEFNEIFEEGWDQNKEVAKF